MSDTYMTALRDALHSLIRQLAEREREDAETPCVLEMKHAYVVTEALRAEIERRQA